MRVVLFVLVALAITARSSFSPLSTFYDIDVSTTASFFSGKSFGPGCARGGSIPHGFIAVAMNGLTMGLTSPASVCGMCVAIRGPPPTSPNPADNQGIVGEYYAYVYEVCEDCTQTAGVQLGIPGSGQSSVVWRAIPCPVASSSNNNNNQVSIFFDGCKETRARFQVRGLSAPIVSATVNGKELSTEGAYFILEGTASVFPFKCDIATALGEQLAITIPAFREHGALTDLITVTKKVEPRTTSMTAPIAESQYGTGEITTISGPQTRTVKTTNQIGRQILTITNSPNENALGAIADDFTGNAKEIMSLPPPTMNSPMASTMNSPMSSTMSSPATSAMNRRAPLYANGLNDGREALETGTDFLSKPLGIQDLNGGPGARYEQMFVQPGAMNFAGPERNFI